MYQTLLTSLDNQVLTVTFNRPDKLNAINKTVMSELEQVFNDVYTNKDIRGVILTGAGPKAFVAGADISEFTGLSVEEGKQLAKRGLDVFFKIENCPKPVIAAINGFALGAGCEVAMACHFRLASENAKFGQPEVNLGLIPGYGGTQRLVQLIGKGRAIELLITGNIIDASQAKEYGLISYVVPADLLLEKANLIFETVRMKAPLAIAKCIEAANAVFDDTKNGYNIEMNNFGECFGTSDMKEGTAAFLEKRKAVFTGR